MNTAWQELFALPPERRPAHRVHLIGIGGAGLAPIARVLLQMGFQVSGSDRSASERLAELAQDGASVYTGHDAAHLRSTAAPELPGVVLISSAVPPENPEVRAANALGIPVVRRHEFLGPLTANRRVIAVAGTHGKTTTTAMIAHVLVHAGRKPGYIIGSQVRGLGISAAGLEPAFVVEADEYDYAFLGLRPDVAVITSLEWDHPDCFPTPESYFDAFRRFVGNVRAGGRVIYCQDERQLQQTVLGAAELGQKAGDGLHLQGYGSRGGAEWHVREIEIDANGAAFSLQAPDGRRYAVRLGVPGLHNVLNATAALLAAHSAGLELAESIPLLATYRGAGRRFEIKGEAGGVLVIDDYAHHPTEIRTTLAAARAAYPQAEIWAVYEPHTYSRTRALLDRFDGVFAAADRVLISPIFAAREAPDPNVTPALVVAASRHPAAAALGSLAAIEAHLLKRLQPGSLVLILSAGPATSLGPRLLAAIDHQGSMDSK